jgi:hypothetical protein
METEIYSYLGFNLHDQPSERKLQAVGPRRRRRKQLANPISSLADKLYGTLLRNDYALD